MALYIVLSLKALSWRSPEPQNYHKLQNSLVWNHLKKMANIMGKTIYQLKHQ